MRYFLIGYQCQLGAGAVMNNFMAIATETGIPTFLKCQQRVKEIEGYNHQVFSIVEFSKEDCEQFLEKKF